MEIDLTEKEYRWLDAAKAYEQTLQSKSASVSSAAELWFSFSNHNQLSMMQLFELAID